MTEIEEKRFTLDDMQEFRPTPHLDLPDLHEVACLQPKDGSPYMLFLCEESKPLVCKIVSVPWGQVLQDPFCIFCCPTIPKVMLRRTQLFLI